ncbi:hypothetical protein, partial [Faecalibacter macacae]
MKKEITKRFLMTFVLLLTNIVLNAQNFYSPNGRLLGFEINASSAKFDKPNAHSEWYQNTPQKRFKSFKVTKDVSSIIFTSHQSSNISNTDILDFSIVKIEVEFTENIIDRFKLEVSSNNNFVLISNIVEILPNKISYKLPEDSNYRFFRLTSAERSSVKVKSIKVYYNIPTSTIWNGTSWSNGIPNSELDAIIRGGYNSGFADSNGKVVAKSYKIESDITIPKGITIESVNEFNNSLNKNVIFEDKSYFLQTNPLAVNLGNVTFKVKSQKMKRNDMTHWSSPVTGQFIRAFSPETLYNRFWYYNENTSNYKTVFTSANSSDVKFEAGKGVAIRLKHGVAVDFEESIVGEFKGVLNNGEIKVTVNKSENSNGYNFIGNPYPSNLNVTEFFKHNLDVNKIFVWTPYFKIDDKNFGNNYITVNRDGVVSP